MQRCVCGTQPGHPLLILPNLGCAVTQVHRNSASSLSPSTVPGLQQHQRGVPGVLHHIQCCLRELQVNDFSVLGAELGTTASEEVWGQPGTRDLPTCLTQWTNPEYEVLCH